MKAAARKSTLMPGQGLAGICWLRRAFHWYGIASVSLLPLTSPPRKECSCVFSQPFALLLPLSIQVPSESAPLSIPSIQRLLSKSATSILFIISSSLHPPSHLTIDFQNRCNLRMLINDPSYRVDVRIAAADPLFAGALSIPVRCSQRLFTYIYAYILSLTHTNRRLEKTSRERADNF